MKRRKRRRIKIRHIILVCLIVLVLTFQFVSTLGHWYAQGVYPIISKSFIYVSSKIPFSIGDVFIALSLVLMIILPMYFHRKRRMSWKRLLRYDAEYLLWIYVWFYLAWGLNYSQPDLYHRTQIKESKFEQKAFNDFVHNYIIHLNENYTQSVFELNKPLVCSEVKRIYAQISDTLGVHSPKANNYRVKTMLFSNFMSSMGVTGYMGPFFSEFHLNANLLPFSYPATYAHEMAHLLGISSEAEANFYAYEVCIRSSDKKIRFSGYFFILGYVLHNARILMSDNEYEKVKKTIRPEIKSLYMYYDYYWQALYNPVLGKVQNWVYDMYLKGNKIQAGQKNYLQVVNLLISYEQYKKKK